MVGMILLINLWAHQQKVRISVPFSYHDVCYCTSSSILKHVRLYYRERAIWCESKASTKACIGSSIGGIPIEVVTTNYVIDLTTHQLSVEHPCVLIPLCLNWYCGVGIL